MATRKFETIDEYIAAFPEDVRRMLERVRRTIRKAAPEAVETISYQIPTFKLNGNLISFAAFKHHIGMYPAPAGTKAYQTALSPYKAAKASIRFPLDQSIPYELVSQTVLFRLKETAAKKRGKVATV